MPGTNAPRWGTRSGRRARWLHPLLVLLVALSLPAVASASATSATPTPTSSGGRPAAGSTTAAETVLPTLPLPDCKANGLTPTDLVDCEGETLDFSNLDANVPRPVGNQLSFSMGTRVLDFRKDADRPGSQVVTFSWTAPASQTNTVGDRIYTSAMRYIWPSTIEGGETNLVYLKRRVAGGTWNPDAEGAPYGTSSNPPRVLFERIGDCGSPQTYSTLTSCSYKVTWGDYGQRVYHPMIFRVGIKAGLVFETVTTQGFGDCAGLPAKCGFAQGVGYTTFRTVPPPPLVAVAEGRRLGPKQFEFDASGSYPDVVQTNWSLVNPVITSTLPVLPIDFDDYTLSDTYQGGFINVNVRDKWGRVAFASVDFSFLQQVGTEGPLKVKSVAVVGVSGGILTLTVVVENTTTAQITRVGVIGKRTPSSNAVKTSPASVTIPAKGTKEFTVTMPVDSLTELDAVSQAFGLQSSSPVRSAPLTTHVVVADQPGPNCTPGQPVATAATATSVTLTTPKGTCTPSGATAATGLRLLGYAGSSATATITKDLTLSDTSTQVTGLAAGTRYRFRLVGRDAEGNGPNGPLSAWALPPFPTLDSFTNRQYLDFAGTAPTAAQKADWSSKLGGGTLTAVNAVDQAVDLPYWAKQSPMVRLYQAYFGRLPDASGLSYWTNKSRSGTSIYKISSTFAGSSEFTAKYGTLTNKQFVELVYQNVLGRPGDAGGVASWTSKLDRKVKNRGEVMVGFSESGEYKTKTASIANIVNVYTGMLRRVPTAPELATWKPQLDGGTARSVLVASIFGSAPYDARVP